MCPESIVAIEGALGTVCEAVDSIFSLPTKEVRKNEEISRAFVAIRPPGHHCGEDTPSGFCFVNNVAVAAAHGELYSLYHQIYTSAKRGFYFQPT